MTLSQPGSPYHCPRLHTSMAGLTALPHRGTRAQPGSWHHTTGVCGHGRLKDNREYHNTATQKPLPTLGCSSKGDSPLAQRQRTRASHKGKIKDMELEALARGPTQISISPCIHPKDWSRSPSTASPTSPQQREPHSGRIEHDQGGSVQAKKGGVGKGSTQGEGC